MKRPADEEVMYVLNLVRMCQEMQVLPETGGLFDQDALFVYLLEVIMQADYERQQLEHAKSESK